MAGLRSSGCLTVPYSKASDANKLCCTLALTMSHWNTEKGAAIEMHCVSLHAAAKAKGHSGFAGSLLQVLWQVAGSSRNPKLKSAKQALGGSCASIHRVQARVGWRVQLFFLD